MQLSSGKVLFTLLIFALLVWYHSPRSTHSAAGLTGDAAVCANLSPDPSSEPFISYSTPEGFHQCVSRCMTSVMRQVCGQLPDKSNVFATQPQIKEKMLSDCTQNINDFVANKTRCPYLNCQP